MLDLSIVVPAFNEVMRIRSTLEGAVKYFRSLNLDFQIIVVDDGSTDNTAELVTSLSKADSEIELLTYPDNQGKGYAVKFGVLNAKGSKILIMDADGSTPLPEFIKLDQKLDEGFKVAIGSRALFDESSKVKTVWYRRALGRVFNNLVNVILVPGIKDTQCGFKLFTNDLAMQIFPKQTINGFAFDCELLHNCQKLGVDIAEVPINWNNVSGSKVNLALHPLIMLKEILFLRFSKH